MTDFNAETATVQEAVDYSVQQIVKQGGKCMYNNVCVYGNNEGSHCAIGWLLDDQSSAMDCQGTVVDLIDENEEAVPNVVKQNQMVFHTLQRFHDQSPKESRNMNRKSLENQGIDVSGEWFQKWIDMGEEY